MMFLLYHVHQATCMFIRPHACSSGHVQVHQATCKFIRQHACSSGYMHARSSGKYSQLIYILCHKDIIKPKVLEINANGINLNIIGRNCNITNKADFSGPLVFCQQKKMPD